MNCVEVLPADLRSTVDTQDIRPGERATAELAAEVGLDQGAVDGAEGVGELALGHEGARAG